MSTERIIYELREYLVSEGRVLDEIDRARATIIGEKADEPSLFDRHAIPRPWAMFRCVHGRPLPCIAFVYPWDSTAIRALAFPSLYADPRWHELRARTNGAHEIVERIDDLIFHGPRCSEKARGPGLFEFCRGDAGDADEVVLGPLVPLCGDDGRPFFIRRLASPIEMPIASGRKFFELIELER